MLDKILTVCYIPNDDVIPSYARNRNLLLGWQLVVFKRRHQLNDNK